MMTTCDIILRHYLIVIFSTVTVPPLMVMLPVMVVVIKSEEKPQSHPPRSITDLSWLRLRLPVIRVLRQSELITEG